MDPSPRNPHLWPHIQESEARDPHPYKYHLQKHWVNLCYKHSGTAVVPAPFGQVLLDAIE